MDGRRYVERRWPWHATIDLTSAQPARYLADLIAQALRTSLPSRRPLGRLRAFVARRGVPRRTTAAVLRCSRRVPQQRLDRLLAALTDSWPQLVDAVPDLPPRPPSLSALALRRSAAQTVFVFGEQPAPLLVAKLPLADDAQCRAEIAVLHQLAGTGLAPRPMGVVGGAWVQEALDAAPLRLHPLRARDAAVFDWRPSHVAVAAALGRLAKATGARGQAAEIAALCGRLSDIPLAPHVRRRVDTALGQLARLDRTVLRHGDTSPQNCLVRDGRLVGLVDWELAQVGAPGFDCYNAALAIFEQSLGMVQWSDPTVLSAFRAAWTRSPFFGAARAAAADTIRAAEVPEELLGALEIGFFVRRATRRLDRPTAYAVGPQLAIDMLAVVCTT